MDENLVQSKLHDAHDGTSPAALRQFLRSPKRYARDSNEPYSLCVIEDVPGVGWAATGFISNYVAKFVHKWISDDTALDMRSLNKLLQNSFSHGLFGNIFQDWVHIALGEKSKTLEVHIENRLQTFQFRGVQSYEWRYSRSRQKVFFPCIYLEDEVLNKPEGKDSPSIDGYAVHSNTFLMIQPTVSLTYTEAKLWAVEGLINAAKAKGVTDVLMVYVVLKKNVQHFRVPTCAELSGSESRSVSELSRTNLI